MLVSGLMSVPEVCQVSKLDRLYSDLIALVLSRNASLWCRLRIFLERFFTSRVADARSRVSFYVGVCGAESVRVAVSAPDAQRSGGLSLPPPSVRARFRVTAAFIHQRFNTENLMWETLQTLTSTFSYRWQGENARWSDAFEGGFCTLEPR